MSDVKKTRLFQKSDILPTKHCYFTWLRW